MKNIGPGAAAHQRRKVVFFLLITAVLLTGLFYTTYAEAAGLKKLVAVSRFDNKSNWRGQWNLSNGMTDQLTDALMQSKKVMVLERETLGDVISEQNLAASGRAMKSKSARTGKITSAQILIKGAITEFSNSSKGSDSGVRYKGISVGGGRGEAHVGLIIRMIDTTTSQVLASKRVEGKAKAGGFRLGINRGGIGFGTKGFKKTPLGKATQIAIDNAVEQILATLEDVPYQGRVIKVSGSSVYLSAGERTGASVGDVFTVYNLGEELVDPDTGEILGSEEEAMGKVKIYKVMKKFSKAKKLGSLKVSKGDIVRE